MAQADVYKWLREQRLQTREYFRIVDIFDGLRADAVRCRYPNIWRDVIALARDGWLEQSWLDKYREHRRVYRLKKEHI